MIGLEHETDRHANKDYNINIVEYFIEIFIYLFFP